MNRSTGGAWMFRDGQEDQPMLGGDGVSGCHRHGPGSEGHVVDLKGAGDVGLTHPVEEPDADRRPEPRDEGVESDGNVRGGEGLDRYRAVAAACQPGYFISRPTRSASTAPAMSSMTFRAPGMPEVTPAVVVILPS